MDLVYLLFVFFQSLYQVYGIDRHDSQNLFWFKTFLTFHDDY